MFIFRIGRVIKSSKQRISTIKELFMRNDEPMYKVSFGTGLLIISEAELKSLNRGKSNEKYKVQSRSKVHKQGRDQNRNRR